VVIRLPSRTVCDRKQVEMKHEVSFSAAELAGLEVKTAKTGKDYAKGVIILRNDEGKFQASLPFLCFTAAVGHLRSLEQQEHSMELVGGETPETTEQRPRANVSGWFRTSKTDKGWTTSFMIESVN
jgi:hypothetical protein